MAEFFRFFVFYLGSLAVILGAMSALGVVGDIDAGVVAFVAALAGPALIRRLRRT